MTSQTPESTNNVAEEKSENASNAQDASKAKTSNSKLKKLAPVIAITVVVAGLLAMIYPIVATISNNYHQAKVAKENRTYEVKKLGDNELQKIRKKAEEYNKDLANGPILDPFLQRVAPNTKLYREYLSIMNFKGGVIGSIYIPKIRVNLPIYHGSDDAVLQKGVGHLYGSAFPIGGKGTHALLAGHSGLSNATMFDNLPELKKGDVFYINVLNETLKYKVDSTQVVSPTSIKELQPIPGKDIVTLITCTPYGINTDRLLVNGIRVPLDASDKTADAQPVSTLWQTWMWIPIIVTIIAIIIITLPLVGKRGSRGKIFAWMLGGKRSLQHRKR